MEQGGGRSDRKRATDNRVVEFERLNTVGKAVYLAGGAFRTLGSIFDFTVSTIGDVWIQAEKAFTEGSSEHRAHPGKSSASHTNADPKDASEGSIDALIIDEIEIPRAEKKRRSS
ncbi:MAG: hypothetical protein O3A57_10545 [Bacteroidetes bacterium]|nr:hypothetical protein [Bacteroidota bacterium]